MLPLRPLAALVAAGVLLWQLIEYSLHRWLFHAVPANASMILVHFLMHGCAWARADRHDRCHRLVHHARVPWNARGLGLRLILAGTEHHHPSPTPRLHCRNHHKYPSDIDRLVFPPLPACLPASIIYGTLRACLPQVQRLLPLLCLARQQKPQAGLDALHAAAMMEPAPHSMTRRPAEALLCAPVWC